MVVGRRQQQQATAGRPRCCCTCFVFFRGSFFAVVGRSSPRFFFTKKKTNEYESGTEIIITSSSSLHHEASFAAFLGRGSCSAPPPLHSACCRCTERVLKHLPRRRGGPQCQPKCHGVSRKAEMRQNASHPPLAHRCGHHCGHCCVHLQTGSPPATALRCWPAGCQARPQPLPLGPQTD